MTDESRELRAFAPALILLAICAVINYVDRGNLSVAAPLLKEELRISATQPGILFSVFFWTYTALQLISGWTVDKFDVNRVIAAGFLLWSLATAATDLVRGFTMLLAMRLILGVGESVMVPAYSKILGFHLPEHHRGFANGVLRQSVSGRHKPAVCCDRTRQRCKGNPAREPRRSSGLEAAKPLYNTRHAWRWGCASVG